MRNVVLFAGTTEGREIAAACKAQPLQLHVCVATEYGETLIDEAENVKVLAGRKDEEQMVQLIRETSAELVVDATHPYAEEVTKTIRAACEETGVEYLRVLRAEQHAGAEHCVFVSSTEEAVAYLNTVQGKALLTVGSKELPAYTAVTDCKTRLFARVLPLPEVAAQCAALGFAGKNLICMQGPFSRELNAAMLRMLGAEYLVTKDTGSAGGFPEKLQAAADVGAKVIVVRRPLQESGCSLSEALALLRERYGFLQEKRVTIVGTGMGSPGSMTLDAEHACREAALIVGAKRLTDSLSRFCKPVKNAILAEEIANIVKKSPEKNIVVAMSGDTGFFSGTKKLLPLLSEFHPTVLPGICSLVYFCSRLGVSWDDALLLSAHGRECNFLAKIRRNPKVLALTGGTLDAAALLGALAENGLGAVRVAVGERLSYPDERITRGTAAELSGQQFDSLAVLLAENPAAQSAVVTHGLPDEAFLRAEVPMTKQEVRAVTLSKLRLTKNAVCYDVGAGTGSVSLEMADCCEDGVVYAIERKDAACQLIEQNKLHLGISNVTVVPGVAPDALQGLPAPTHVFIGGSSGNLRAIFQCLLEKNPGVRIVLNTVTAESFAEAVTCLQELPVQDVEIVQLSAARGQKLGRYHLMTAQNPVFILSCTGGSANDAS